VLGKFKLIAELGRGGMSEVYLAVIAGPAGFNKLVVVKLIKAELAEDPDFISMFLEEARLSARLSHPNVVQTNEVGEFNGRYYIAMEYLEGQAYSRILHRLGRDRGLPLGMSLRTLSDVLQGLHYAHELADFDGSPLGVVHRDVTPHNVFITYDGQVKVVDFGIAKAMNSSHETRTGMLKGKVGYMAPEQARGERVDRRADIFSVGVMLWEAAVGKRLWKGLNEVQILHQLLSGEIPSPRSMRPDISLQLESIIMKAVAMDRDRRHSTALELQSELDELMDSGSERSTLREVGRLLSTTFEDERRKLKGIIEQQVAKSSMLATGLYQQMPLPAVEQPNFTGEVPRLSMGPMSGSMGSHTGASNSFQPQYTGQQPVQPSPTFQGHSPSYSHPGAQFAHQTGSFQNQSQLGSNPQQGSNAAPSHPGSGSHPGHSHVASGSHPGVSQHAGHSFSGSYPGAGAHPGLHSSIPRFSPPMSGSEPGHSSQPSFSNSINHASVATPRAAKPSTNRLTLVALGVAAAAGGAAALLYVGFSKAPASAPVAASAPAAVASQAAVPAPAPTASPVALATAPQSADAATSHKLKVKVSPDTADIFLDGKKVGTGSYEGLLKADGTEHELKVDAPGYASKSRTLTGSEDVTWDVELTAERRTTGGPVTKSTAAPTADPTPVPTATATGPLRDSKGRVIRPIDSSYPGGN
jgi:serine/threonine protein kinase